MTDQVPTLADLYQAKKDVKDINTFTKSPNHTFVDSDGREKFTLEGVINSVGYYSVNGSFETGGTLTDRNQVLLRSTEPAAFFSWGGELPKVVPAGSTVAGTGGESVNGWTNRNDITITQALANGTAMIAGVTATQVALAADIAIGNFVTPEQFFAGDPNSSDVDYQPACAAALATGKRLLLRRMYQLGSQLNVPAGGSISGISRFNTGFIRRASSTASGGVIAFSSNDVTLHCFKVDANNVGSSPSNRLNGVSVNQPAKRFNITQVDVYNATGYGHVTFGSETDPQVTGNYYDCYVENCQVLYEQIGALDVSLTNCIGLGNAGRTLSIFHPYAGSKRVTYTNCHGRGSAGAGIEAIVTSGQNLGPFTFINSSVDIVGTTSAIYSAVVSGDPTATVDMFFHGGMYRTSQGQSATLTTRGQFKAVGTRFEGYGGFNCPAIADMLAPIELIGCDVIAELNDATGTVFALITNGNNPKIIGGRVIARNNLEAGAQAVLGAAIISRETTVLPVAASQQVAFVAEVAGSVALQADAATLGLAVINLPINQTDASKVIVSLSINNRGASDYLSQPHQLTWKLSGGGSSITVRYAGNSPADLWISYRVGILP